MIIKYPNRGLRRLDLASAIENKLRPNLVINQYWYGAGGGGIPSQYLDSLATTPSAVWSLRKLISDATNAIRVRRSSDNTEQDIGFAGDVLDTASLTTFVGANSAYVVTWYDQTGNGFDWTQSTTASQPRIVNAGVLDSGLVFDGSNDYMSIASLTLGTAYVGMYSNINIGSFGSTMGIFQTGSVYYTTGGLTWYTVSSLSKLITSEDTNFLHYNSNQKSDSTGFRQRTCLFDRTGSGSTELKLYSAGSDLGYTHDGQNYENTGNFATQAATLGRSEGSNYCNFTFETLVLYAADTTSLRTDIESRVENSMITISAVDKHADITLSNGDLRGTRAAGTGWRLARATQSRNTGKWYFEGKLITEPTDHGGAEMVGLVKAATALTNYCGQQSDDLGFAFDETSQRKIWQNASSSSYGSPCNANDYVYVAWDADSGQVWLKTSNVAGWLGGGDPSTATTPTITLTQEQDLFPAISLYYGTSAVELNFGATTFNGSVPSGFRAYNDPADAYETIKSLLHFNGTDGSTTFTDESGKSWTAVGNAQIDTAQSVFGGASGLFDGTDDAIYTVEHYDFKFPGDFRIRCRFRLNTTGTWQTLITTYYNASNGWTLRVSNGNKLQFLATGNGVDIEGSTTLTTGVWYAVSISRVSGTLYLHLDGVSDATPVGSISGTLGAPQRTSIGGLWYSGSYIDELNGWIDELCVQKRTGQTSNYTVESGEFTYPSV